MANEMYKRINSKWERARAFRVQKLKKKNAQNDDHWQARYTCGVAESRSGEIEDHEHCTGSYFMQHRIVQTEHTTNKMKCIYHDLLSHIALMPRLWTVRKLFYTHSRGYLQKKMR